MVLQHCIKTRKISVTCAVIKITLILKQNSIFHLGHTEKSPVMKLVSSIKKLVAHASLKRSYRDQISMPHQLFEWALKNISSMNFNFEFSTKEEYVKSISFLNDHFNQAVTIYGIYQYHTFILSDESTSKKCM